MVAGDGRRAVRLLERLRRRGGSGQVGEAAGGSAAEGAHGELVGCGERGRGRRGRAARELVATDGGNGAERGWYIRGGQWVRQA